MNMSQLLKKFLITLSIIASALFPVLAHGQSGSSLWKFNGTSLLPVNATWSLQIPQINSTGSTKCVQVSSTGIFSTAAAACGSGGGSTSPGGSNTQVQFNDSGSFGGDASLTYDKVGNILKTLNIQSLAGGLNFIDENGNTLFDLGASNTDAVTFTHDAPYFQTITGSLPAKFTAGSQLTSGLIDLTSDVTGILPYANIQQDVVRGMSPSGTLNIAIFSDTNGNLIQSAPLSISDGALYTQVIAPTDYGLAFYGGDYSAVWAGFIGLTGGAGGTGIAGGNITLNGGSSPDSQGGDIIFTGGLGGGGNGHVMISDISNGFSAKFFTDDLQANRNLGFQDYSGYIALREEVQNISGTYTIDIDAENNINYYNTDNTAVNLPSAALGLTYHFTSSGEAEMRVNANGNTILFGNMTVTGSVFSTSTGSTFTLIAITDSVYQARSITGHWSIEP